MWKVKSKSLKATMLWKKVSGQYEKRRNAKCDNVLECKKERKKEKQCKARQMQSVTMCWDKAGWQDEVRKGNKLTNWQICQHSTNCKHILTLIISILVYSHKQ